MPTYRRKVMAKSTKRITLDVTYDQHCYLIAGMAYANDTPDIMGHISVVEADGLLQQIVDQFEIDTNEDTRHIEGD
jgi:hypothetical protein